MSHKKTRNAPENKIIRPPRAEARYVRTSAQKVRLVLNLIRGLSANEARMVHTWFFVASIFPFFPMRCALLIQSKRRLLGRTRI